jgi:hypothetical protein
LKTENAPAFTQPSSVDKRLKLGQPQGNSGKTIVEFGALERKTEKTEIIEWESWFDFKAIENVLVIFQ